MKKLLLQLILVLLLGTVTTTNILLGQTDVEGGDVSGTWTLDNSPYLVNGDITIPDGQTLTIEPGVEVIFTDHYRFDIQGQLQALGTKDLMITFTAQDSITAWNGLRFIDIPITNDSSKLVYCKVQYGFPTGISEEDKSGGGIFVQSANKLLVQFCEITGNRTLGDPSWGAGIAILNCSPRITQNMITDNNAQGGHGGGIAIIYESAKPVVTDNVILNNTAQGGGGIATALCEPVLFNNTITGNIADHGGALDCIGAVPTFINMIIYGNSANDAGDEVHLAQSFSTNFLYCDIEGGMEAFAYYPAPPISYPGRYEYNIDTDPLFVDFFNDFHLMGYSPCIGSGIQSVEVDGVTYHAPETDFEGQSRPMPIGSYPDIGAIENEFGIPTGIEQIENSVVAKLLQIYPNPVNQETRIHYYMDQSAIVNIELFDLSGKRIITLTDSFQTFGEHFATWNTNSVSDGIYICTMKTNGIIDSRQIIVQR